MNLDKVKIGIIGLGYVGLPLAAEFGTKVKVVGFDLKNERIDELRLGIDSTMELSTIELESAKHLSFTSTLLDLQNCNVYIITVPTPLDKSKKPDLNPLKSASEMVGKILSRGDIVIYESTVYPGATEEFCVPILENVSELKFNVDFFAGYSPERINPGDKKHRLPSIVKVTSGSNTEVAHFIDELYATIILAGTHLAESIKVAEAAKVIENTQRDINIALMNELSIIFDKLNIETAEVLKAAITKWNFLNFTPGLVGGHCIGVDPFYLTHKAQQVGYNAEVILSGRRVNDSMAEHIAMSLVKAVIKNNKTIHGAKILILGLTFKENCPDIRNTKVVDIYTTLKDLGLCVDINDPWVNKSEAMTEYGIEVCEAPASKMYDGIILAVPHSQFLEMGHEAIKNFGNQGSVFYDVKSSFPKNCSDLRL